MTSLKRHAPWLLLGFVLGAAAGFALPRFHWRHRARDPERLVRRFTRELKLRDDQQQVVRRALEESAARIEATRRESQARLKEISLSTRGEIRETLDAEQQKAFDRMAERWDGRRHRHGDVRP